MRRRRRSKVDRVPSDDVESQGDGTWIGVQKKLSMQHLRPVLQLAAWREDPRITGEAGQAAMVEALEEMLDRFGVALYPLVTSWNWVTDMEGELAAPPEVASGSDQVRVRLETPIWAGSDFRVIGEDGQPGKPEFADGQPVYLGSYPEDCQTLQLEGTSDDGRILVLRGQLTRKYEPGAHYAIVGLPDPDGPEAFAWLGLEEMTWIVSVISERFQAEMKRQEGHRHPKAKA